MTVVSIKSLPNGVKGARANATAGPPGWSIPGLDFASFRISLIAKVMDRLTMRHMSQVTELTLPEWRALSRIAVATDGTSTGKIADAAWVDRAEVSRATTSLEKKGLIRRENNPHDKRTPLFFATVAGEALFDKLIKARSDFHLSIVECLDEDEREELDRLLLKIADRLIGLRENDV